MIKNESLELLKSRIDIVEVIGGYIELKRAGSTFKGCCPFHDEKTPSFNVNPSKQFYHCFGCKAGGDAIKFVQEFERITFTEAVEKLAGEYNITLEYENSEAPKRTDNRPLEALNRFFLEELGHTPHALAYLRERGVSEGMMERFEIGYAPESGPQQAVLQRAKIPMPAAIEAGAFSEDERARPYARFTQRVTFPIRNAQGVLVGFGGRTLSNHPAKYVNSPQSTLFNKSRLLYALHLAKDAVLKRRSIVVAEGYLDVVMLHQAGFENAVATLGTALTEEHLPLLRRLDDPAVILSYDSDSAGKEAAFKASKLLAAHGFKGGVAMIEGGKDPADLVKSGQSRVLDKLYAHPKPFAHFALDTIIDRALQATPGPEGRDRALQEAQSFLATLGPLSHESYALYAAGALGIDSRRLKGFKPAAHAAPGGFFTGGGRQDLAELTLLKALALDRSLLESLIDYLDIALFETHGDLFAALGQNDVDNPKIRGLLFDEAIKPLGQEELRDKLRALLVRHFDKELNRLRTQRGGDFAALSFSLRQIQEAIRRLRGGELVVFRSFRT